MECFYKQIDLSGDYNDPAVERGQGAVEGTFEVTRGGLLDIGLKVFDPQDTLILERMAFFNNEVSQAIQRYIP